MADHRDGTSVKFEHDLIHRAIGDAAFRAELIANPTGVVQRELAKVGGGIAGNVKVHVVEETASSLYIVLPPHGYIGGGYNPYRIGTLAGAGIEVDNGGQGNVRIR